MPDPERVAFITQTTLSVDETAEIITRLRKRFPKIVSSEVRRHLLRDDEPPDRGQAAGGASATSSSSSARRNSSNSNRLVEVAREHGAASHLIDNATQVEEELARWRRDASASPPAPAPPRSWSPSLVEFFRDRGTDDVSELRTVDEEVRFMLPKKIRDELGGACVAALPRVERLLIRRSLWDRTRRGGRTHRDRLAGAVARVSRSHALLPLLCP